MRIFLSSLFILAHLLCLSLPATGAALDGSSINTGAQVNRGVVEGSNGRVPTLPPDAKSLTAAFGAPDIIKARSSFLSPSHIIESIQNATQAFVAPEPSPSDFWETAKEYEKTLQDHVLGMLGDAAEFFKSTNFTDIASAMHHIVNATTTFREDIKGALDVHGITFDTLTEELEGVFMVIVNNMEKIMSPAEAPGHAEREKIVDKVLDDTALALKSLATRYGIEEEVITTYVLALKPHMQALTVAIGDINEQHPDLLPALAFSVAARLIPKSWILRPFLSVFGFGPAGPVKGSAAAWLQSRLWGAAVKSDSWFSLLQKAGMGAYPKSAGFLAKLSLWTGGLLAMFLPSSKPE